MKQSNKNVIIIFTWNKEGKVKWRFYAGIVPEN